MLARLFGVRPAHESVPHWHVSPLVDILAYHFSWVFALVPLLFMGDRHPEDYLLLFLFVIAGNFAHQALSLPIVYLDGEVFRRFWVRCTVFPLLMVAGFAFCLRYLTEWVPPHVLTPIDALASAAAVVVLLQLRRAPRPRWTLAVAALAAFLPWLVPAYPSYAALAVLAFASSMVAAVSPGSVWRWLPPVVLTAVAGWTLVEPRVAAPWPEKRFRFFLVIGTISTIAYLWNFWHVYMQKYGILRVYNAKASRRIPTWVDRLLVFGWLPLTMVVLGPRYRGFLMSHYPDTRTYLGPFLAWLERWEAYLLGPVIALAVASVALFLWHEWKEHRLRSVPRLSMGLGTTLLFASILVFNPIKAVLAFGFSHVLEYFVFVWAYERRRYGAPLPHRPPLAYLIRHPMIAYPLFLLLVGGGYFVFTQWGEVVFPGAKPPRPFGRSLPSVLLLLATFQAMTHFYFDGFLWKMRQPAVARNI